MPARHTFFSFHYQRDIWRANIVRKSGAFFEHAAAGFHDKSLWEATKLKGDAAIKKLIDDGLYGTSVTCVLIGAETANRKYVNYEIEQSLARKNGVFGLHVHTIKDQYGYTDTKGTVPSALTAAGCNVHTWTGVPGDLGRWVEAAFERHQLKEAARRF